MGVKMICTLEILRKKKFKPGLRGWRKVKVLEDV